MFIYVLVSSIIVSLISFVGVFFLSVNKNVLNKILFILIAFAAGAMLGNVFFEIFPEVIGGGMDVLNAGLFLMIGFVLFFIIEKAIHWHHCHDVKCQGKRHIKSFGYLNLIGDGVHNFFDGILIAVSYIASIPIGIATTMAVIAHEVPQEIGDFGVLVYAGFTRKKALLFNFLSALLAVLGATVGWFALKNVGFIDWLLPVAGGSLMYIATADLIPQLNREEKLGKAFLALIFFILGLAVLYLMQIGLI